MKNTNTMCASCLMPFSKDPGVRESDQYCSYCFKDGKLCFEGSREDFEKVCYAGMRRNGVNIIAAKFFTWMIHFAPRWKK